jgi:predicted ferric reductase
LIVFIPLVVFLFANIHRHLHGQALSLDEKLKQVSNSFADAALIAMSYFLIPVARQSPLLKFINWSPAAAVRLHIWSGRTIILGVLVHGVMHVIRWTNLSGENLVRMTFPPAPCWTLHDTPFEPTCNDTETECSCYYLFRNLTGFLGLLDLLVIAITTVSYVRRNHYRVFYMAHVLAAPTVFIMVILHWRRSVLYMVPSLLYYAASSAPLLIESALKNKDSGVRIVAAKYIASSDRHCERPCVSLTLEVSKDASLNFAPGQYVHLLAPNVSTISHPFTINRVPGKRNEMRIIFRAAGPFTRMLAHSLTLGSSKLPVIHMDGFHGTTQRLNQVLKHDVAVLVAGGIGITPYLSLLYEVVSTMRLRQPSMQDAMTKEVILHWMCRDQALLEYVTDQYFEPLRWLASEAGCRIRIVVHRTNPKSAEMAFLDRVEMVKDRTIATDKDGLPFTPSRFSSGNTTSMFGNLFPFVTFATTAWIGLWVTWRLYMTAAFEHKILGRGWTALAIIAIAVVVALLANFATRVLDRVLLAQQPLALGLLENVNNEHQDVEMESVKDDFAKQSVVKSDYVEVSSNLTAVTYEESVGRPTVHQLLKSLDDARCPGLFVCGPKSLTQDLRDAAEEHCQIRIRHCRSGTFQIAIYEETFQL